MTFFDFTQITNPTMHVAMNIRLFYNIRIYVSSTISIHVTMHCTTIIIERTNEF